MNTELARFNMVEQQIRTWHVLDMRVLGLLAQLDRSLFVPSSFAALAYSDTEIPLSHGEHMMVPRVDARLLQDLQLQPHETVLEVGTGSGYQAAVLGAVGLEVYTVERIGDLLRQARKRFRALGMNIRTKHDDGRAGWAEHGPFDAIVVTAAAPALVDALVEQLAVGGRLVAPVGGPGAQSLVQLTRRDDGSIEQQVLAPVTFVPLLSGMLD